MAFMEKPPAGKVLLDDTVPLTAQIEASQSLHSHTEYIIRVQRGVSAENSWQIVRRYSDFDLLNNSLQDNYFFLVCVGKSRAYECVWEEGGSSSDYHLQE